MMNIIRLNEEMFVTIILNKGLQTHYFVETLYKSTKQSMFV